MLNGATLHLNVATAPPVGTVLTLVSSQIGTVTGQLLSRTGATLTNGEFVDSGQRWSIGIGQGSECSGTPSSGDASARWIRRYWRR